MEKKYKSLLSLAVLIILWHFLARFMMKGIPLPVDVARAFVFSLFNREPIMGRTILEHAWMSIVRIGAGSLMAFIAAVSLGVMLGCSKRAYGYLFPLIDLFRPLPPLAWVPLSILFFGRNGPVFIVFLGAFFPCFLCTLEGVRGVDREWIDFASMIKATRYQAVSKVIIPASMPAILNGIRIGLGVAWMCIIAAEMIAFSSAGLGYYIMVMYDIGRMDYMMAGMMAIGLIGYLLNKLLSAFVRRYTYAR